MSASRKARCYSDGGEVSPRDPAGMEWATCFASSRTVPPPLGCHCQYQETVDEFDEYLKRADHRTRRDRLFDADLAVVCPNMVNRAGFAVSDLS
jgi:hypothetical protein